MARSENAAAVRAMWDAFSRDGVEAFLAQAPEGVEWRPQTADGRTLWGSEDVREMFSAMERRGERIEADITTIEEIGETNVVVTGFLRRHRPEGVEETQLAWLYSFRNGELWRATAHRSAAEAREAARFGGDRLSLGTKRPPPLTVAREDGEGVALLHVVGELDIATAPIVSHAVETASAVGNVRLDLSELEFMDSTGMRSILRAVQSAVAGGWNLTLTRAPDTVQRVFAISGVEPLLPFEPPASASSI